jgi:hypothetical protein
VLNVNIFVQRLNQNCFTTKLCLTKAHNPVHYQKKLERAKQNAFCFWIWFFYKRKKIWQILKKNTVLIKFDQFWSILTKFDQIWSNLIKTWFWSNLIKFDQIWSDLIKIATLIIFEKKHNCGTNVFECSHFCAKLFFGFEQIHICFFNHIYIKGLDYKRNTKQIWIY